MWSIAGQLRVFCANHKIRSAGAGAGRMPRIAGTKSARGRPLGKTSERGEGEKKERGEMKKKKKVTHYIPAPSTPFSFTQSCSSRRWHLSCSFWFFGGDSLFSTPLMSFITFVIGSTFCDPGILPVPPHLFSARLPNTTGSRFLLSVITFFCFRVFCMCACCLLPPFKTPKFARFGGISTHS